jgi:FkbM family methyltransferase
VKVKFSEAHGMYFREGTSDVFILGEQRTYKPLIDLCKGKVVLDLGANIGAFSNNVLKAGAKKVYAFEPEPENIEMIKKQKFYDSERFKLIEKAVSNETGTAEFYVNGKTNKGAHSLRKRRGRDTIEVKTISLQEVIEKTNPDIIKMDIEGAEFALDFSSIFESEVEAIAIEIHFDSKGLLEKAKNMKSKLKKNFKELTKETQSRIAEDKFMKLAFFIGAR